MSLEIGIGTVIQIGIGLVITILAYFSKNMIKDFKEQFKKFEESDIHIVDELKNVSNSLAEYQLQSQRECSRHRNELYENIYKKDVLDERQKAVDNRLGRVEKTLNGNLNKGK